MANGTILSLVQNTLQGMGVAKYGDPTTLVGNTNQDIVQILALINAEGDALAHEKDWQAQQIQYIFTATTYEYTGTVTSGSTSVTAMSSVTGLTTNPTYFQVTGEGIPQDCFITAASGTTVTLAQAATESGTAVTLTFSQILFAPPSDFDRQIDRTHWDKSKHWEMLGPSTPQQREWLRSGYISTGPRIRYSYMGGYFMIWPPLGTTESLSFEYVSKYWVLATAPTLLTPTKQSFTVDTDTCIFPDALMRALIKLKYFEVKGFDTTAYYRDYTQQRDMAKANDGGSQTLSMNPRQASILIGWDQIPDSGFGS
ncbi:MAG: hypothetical protein Q7J84_19035 [Sulfuricaulis sp.]|nr:hypothetical protein [Sulfuricaulis sp.]